jgi:predicted nucleic acid-binding Zn ribbon protein
MKYDRHKRPVAAGSALSSALSGLGLQAALSRHNVIQLWPKIVEAPVSSHAQAEKLVGSTLYVVVDSSVWMNEISAIKNVLLEKINSCLPPRVAPITDIRFHQRSWAGAKALEPRSCAPSPPTDKDVRMARQVLEPVRDEHLKAVLQRILEKDRQLKCRRKSEPKAP